MVFINHPNSTPLNNTHLHDNGTRLPLGNCLVLLEIKVQVVSVAVLEDRAKGIGVYLEHVVQLHYPRMVQRLVDVVFPQGVSERG